MPGSKEQNFVRALEQVQFLKRDLAPVLARLERLQASLASDIHAWQPAGEGLLPDHPLAVQVRDIQDLLQHSTVQWEQKWAELTSTQALADTFDDKVILLVFGKFNAGKSSFCNFLAQRYRRQGRSVRYFHLNAGRLIDSGTPFKEGSTETTAQLQGVELGQNLLLLDTPGLHSVTPENAALTQRYTDSADGVLWLTSSTSPGQVQELDELGRELRRNKPLLPVVTRSDFIDEDEIDGEICKVLCNKSPENRALQEQDVHARAEEKLRQMEVDPAGLRSPVSISCHAALESGQTHQAMQEAGFERLYDALLQIVEPALHYKQRQPAELLLHHIEENVLGEFFKNGWPRLTELAGALQAETISLEQRRADLARRLWREVASTLPERMQSAQSRGLPALCNDVSQGLRQAFETQFPQVMPGYVVGADLTSAQIQLPSQSMALQVCDTVGGGEVAMADESLERLYEALETALRNGLDSLVKAAFEQCAARVETLSLDVQAFQKRIQGYAKQLQEIKEELRP